MQFPLLSQCAVTRIHKIFSVAREQSDDVVECGFGNRGMVQKLFNSLTELMWIEISLKGLKGRNGGGGERKVCR